MTCTHLLKMNFQFLLQGTPIEKEEAAALLKATKGSDKECFPIDLEKVIDLKVLDGRTLFELAVEKRIPDLASLAFKISNPTPKKSSVDNSRKIKRGYKTQKPVKVLEAEDIIETLNKSSSYWAVGAAALLMETSEHEWTTMRELAVRLVNELDKQKAIPKDSVVFKGFIRTREGLEPVDNSKDVERKDTFHVSPLYIGLRQGLIWCVQNNLIEQKSLVSVSPTNENSNKGTMSRIFYRIRATENATAVVSLWADLPNYIETFYRSRRAA